MGGQRQGKAKKASRSQDRDKRPMEMVPSGMEMKNGNETGLSTYAQLSLNSRQRMVFIFCLCDYCLIGIELS